MTEHITQLLAQEMKIVHIYISWTCTHTGADTQ